MTPISARPRALTAVDPDAMIRTLRALIAEGEAELTRLRAELRTWQEAAGRRPDDGSDQPALFEAARQPKLW